uniref:AIG1-type G domain-containing protein n=1 Tax=Amphimedon queenslandica TaxID=400682 RepID=A0A1X7ST41_AMPQE
MATCQGSAEMSASHVSVEQENCDLNESQERKREEAIKRLSQRGEPVNILVIGPTGAGKSTLINALLAKVGYGAGSVQSEIEVHEGKHEGIQLKVYDTTGFSDTRGKSGNSIVKEIAQAGKFDLILICVRMDSRADEKVKDMFRVLRKMINKEMWDRTVIVLTCTNFFLQDREIKKSLNKEEIIKDTIDKIPFCITGEEDKKLPTTHDWIRELWGQCLYRCKEDVRSFLSLIGKCQITLMETGPIYGGTAVGAVVGGAIGGAAGSIVPA